MSCPLTTCSAAAADRRAISERSSSTPRLARAAMSAVGLGLEVGDLGVEPGGAVALAAPPPARRPRPASGPVRPRGRRARWRISAASASAAAVSAAASSSWAWTRAVRPVERLLDAPGRPSRTAVRRSGSTPGCPRSSRSSRATASSGSATGLRLRASPAGSCPTSHHGRDITVETAWRTLSGSGTRPTVSSAARLATSATASSIWPRAA